MIKGSATYYALLVCLIFGALCLSIVMIGGLNKTFIRQQQLKNDILLDMENGIHLGLVSYDLLSEQYDFFEYSDEKYELKNQRWGLLDLIFSRRSKFGKDYERIALIGIEKIDTNTALYLSNKNSALKLSGKTLIKGNCFLPKKGVERGHISGHQFEGKQLISGTQKTAQKSLPQLNEDLKQRITKPFQDNLNEMALFELKQNDTYSFSFSDEINIVREQNITTEGLSLSGNIILQARDSILVSANSQLNNVILIAPTVHVEEGFKGTFQAFATEKIYIGKNSQIQYPSFLVLTEKISPDKKDDHHKIHLDENSVIIGGILAYSLQPDFRKPVEIKVDEDSKVVGDLINYGQTELNGSVWGSLYTSQFILKNAAGKYENYLLDAEINSSKLPEAFVGMNCFEKKENKYKIIAWLR